MSTVIRFPEAVQAIGETFPSATLSAGLAEAERQGIARDRLEAAATTAQDRQLVTYFLGLLGSDDEGERHSGGFGLARLLGTTGGTT